MSGTYRIAIDTPRGSAMLYRSGQTFRVYVRDVAGDALGRSFKLDAPEVETIRSVLCGNG